MSRNCVLCNFTLSDDQREKCSVDKNSDKFNILLYCEKVFEKCSHYPPQNVLQFIQKELRSAGRRESLAELTNLSIEDVTTHFQIHTRAPMNILLAEQLFMFRTLQNKISKHMLSDMYPAMPEPKDLQLLRNVSSEIRNIAKEINKCAHE